MRDQKPGKNQAELLREMANGREALEAWSGLHLDKQVMAVMTARGWARHLGGDRYVITTAGRAAYARSLD